MPENVPEDLRRLIEAVIRDAYRVSEDVGDKVGQILKEGWEQPLSHDEAVRLLTTVLEHLQQKGKERGGATAVALQGDVGSIVQRLIDARERVRQQPTHQGNGQPAPTVPAAAAAGTKRELKLNSMHGVVAGALHPTPVFHGVPVPMNHGFVKLTDIGLWDNNDRLDIHLRQFQQHHGRRPNREELLDIMLSNMHLPGTQGGDEFKIVDLANSIAVNGVREPPIIDLDGTLLDGNRRIAACYYIMNSADFTDEHRRRIEHLYVWQLTPNATCEDRKLVVVSLNFERETKMEWPAYVRARRVFEEWQAMKLREPKASAARLREMMVELSIRFALGPNTDTVRRYLKMVDMADEFEDYHINQMKRDRFEVQHQANHYFEYFDELSKGEKAGGVLHTLNQDEPFKHLVYDLLFQEKFPSFKVIRDLKYMDDEVKDGLGRAREMPTNTDDEKDEAQDLVERILTDARNRNKLNRVGNPNVRIETFVRWLKDLPLSTLQDELRPDVRLSLYDALTLVTDVMEHDSKRKGRRKGGDA